MKKKLVIKIGTSTLTGGTEQISFGKMEDLARQIVELKKDYDVILVSSGAIAAARQFTKLHGISHQIDSKQALAAIGQPKLMKLYDQIFENFGLSIAQCLLTHTDFDNPTSFKNTRNTLLKLWELGYIPIINENDTVATEEIIVGDNDKLSAFVATTVNADTLILASDIDGLYTTNPHLDTDALLIEEVSDPNWANQFAKEKESRLGTGGMTTKIQAAEICHKHLIEMWIVNGKGNNFIINALNGQLKHTKFRSLNNKKESIDTFNT